MSKQLHEIIAEDPTIREMVRRWEVLKWHPEKIRMEAEVQWMIGQVERLEDKTMVDEPIRDRVKKWVNLGWHPEKIRMELEAQVAVTEVEALEKQMEIQDQERAKRPFRGRKLNPKDLEKKDYVTPSEAAVLLGGSADTIKRDCKKLKIEPRRTGGGHWLLAKVDLQKIRRYRSES
jgi:hypothetical protein